MLSPLKSSRSHQIKAQASQLVLECERYLAGEYPSVLQSRGLPIPEWAWLSILAHAPADALVEHARGESRRQFQGHLPSVWLGAVGLLAQELLSVADRTGCSIEKLQHDVMLGVELDWASPTHDDSRTGPSRFVEQVRQSLHRFRDCPRRAEG